MHCLLKRCSLAGVEPDVSIFAARCERNEATEQLRRTLIWRRIDVNERIKLVNVAIHIAECEGEFLAWCPAVDGAFGTGRTITEAIFNCLDVVRLIIGGIGSGNVHSLNGQHPFDEKGANGTKANAPDVSAVISTTCDELRRLLVTVLRNQLPDSILLSGGLDTSILSAVVARWTKPLAITVGFEGAPDMMYARRVAELFQFEHIEVKLQWQQLRRALAETIHRLRTFDPMEVRNSAIVLIALKTAKAHNARMVMTGDGGDELFAGYPFVFELPLNEVKRHTERLIDIMQFSSFALAEQLGLQLIAPFTDDALKQFARNLPPTLLVGERYGQRLGKWLLRIAFKDELPPEIIWRTKHPIEAGSGTSRLPDYFNARVSKGTFD
ncbi:MAG TPA: asparagine synthase, partial [Armatimonadetes bacterium]|nr:asparagine synthase [Armatimonadota bacterium]